MAFVVALLAFVIYIPGFGNDFVYDADVAVRQDTRVHSLDHPTQLLALPYWSFDKERLALYRPVVTLSYAIDWAIHAGRPSGFHFTNALAHALASALVFLLLAALTSPIGALAGAAFFATHPLQTEAVASIVGRADIFAAIFIFAATLVWLKQPARSKSVLIGVPALFLFALGSKESAIMLPALLILVDVATGKLTRVRWTDWLRERALPFGVMAVAAAGYIAVRFAVLGVLSPQSLNPIMEVHASEGARLRTALQIWPEILRLLLFPRTLLVDYSPRVFVPAETWTLRALAGLLLLLGSLVGGVAALLKGHRLTGLALLWAPVALFTVTNLIVPIGVLLAERTLYIAVFAVAIAVAATIHTIGSTHLQRRRVALAVCALVCVLSAARTVSRLPDWSTTEEVFRALLRDRPDSFRAQWQAGFAAAQSGDIASAMKYYVAAMTLWPYNRPMYIEAGEQARQAQQHPAARFIAEQALHYFPEDPVFLRNLAVAAISMNDTTAARAAVARGLNVVPNDELLNLMRAAIGPAR